MRKNIFELIYRYVYPSIKKRLAEIMYREYNLSQTQISKLLYTDQSTIAKYLSGERGKYIDLHRYRELEKIFHEYIEWILKTRPDEYLLNKQLAKLTLGIMGKGYICPYHRELDDELEISRCTICLDLFQDIDINIKHFDKQYSR